MAHPKQLLSLSGERSLLQETVARLQGLARFRVDDRPVVVVNAEYRFTIAQQLREVGVGSPRIVLEPAGRNTAPALTLAALATLGSAALADGRAGNDHHDPVLLVMPADHVIRDRDAFLTAVAEGYGLASEGAVVTFGIVPHRPETSYGYIRLGAPLAEGTARRMAGFTEKPDAPTAGGYLDSGDYLWNSGIFMLRRSVWLAAIEQFAPDILEACRAACANANHDGDFIWAGREQFLASPSDSIDYAVMERLLTPAQTIPALVVPLDVGWSDVGAWDAWWEVACKDGDGNATRGDAIVEHCRDTLVHADHRTVVAVRCDKMVIVESADAILVAPMDEAQAVKQVVSRLAEERPELTQTHRRVFRPWGSYDSVDSGDRFQVKHIVVDPGASISLQYHRHRAEHWVVVRGTAEVTRGDEVFQLTENQSTYVPPGETHRLANRAEVPLEIIEIQSGAYLGEDDIVRIEDRYGREPG
jgi:mannose-1-phosphate guanylyltransferase / mannose-6-phosphate isomerase